MKIALFGGSFDPVHSEHVKLVKAAISALALDKLIVMPSHIAPHKRGGAFASDEARIAMCKIAFSDLPAVEVSDFEVRAGGTSYTYLTCEAFQARYPGAQLFFLVGADMLEDFFTWREPERILRAATLVACGRGALGTEGLHARFFSRFGCDYRELDFHGEEVSSTCLRCELAFGKRPEALDGAVYEYIRAQGLYAHPSILPALALEKEERQKHSFRVAVMATARARSAGVSEEKALLAAALHDCAKYVPLTSPLLKGFALPHEVPAPVVHQYSGAYLAEHTFGIGDEEILNAIRYHTSGRAGMTALEALIFLADMLEPSRDFPGVEELRDLFWKDLFACLRAALLQQVGYLKETKKPVYPLTEQAFAWINGENSSDS